MHPSCLNLFGSMIIAERPTKSRKAYRQHLADIVERVAHARRCRRSCHRWNQHRTRSGPQGCPIYILLLPNECLAKLAQANAILVARKYRHLARAQTLRGHLSPSIKFHVAVVWKGAPILPVVLGHESQHPVAWNLSER